MPRSRWAPLPSAALSLKIPLPGLEPRTPLECRSSGFSEEVTLICKSAPPTFDSMPQLPELIQRFCENDAS